MLIDVALDFETFYDPTYTLRLLTVPEYLMDQRFEAIGASIGIDGAKPVWYSGDHAYMSQVFADIPWDRTRVIAHNALFDGSILEWIYGFKPAKYLCTMMGSRPYVAPYTGSMSLEHVANYFQVGVKGHEVLNAVGKRRADFSGQELAHYGDYCINDTTLAYSVARILDGYLPVDEADDLDLTIKKFVRPRLVLDSDVIKARMAQIEDARVTIENRAALLGISPTTLRSRPKFAAALLKFGVTAETKISKRTGLPTLAFAKDDEQMVDLLVHPNIAVRTLAEAKIFSSSTMETKRLERFLKIYDVNVGGEHLLPVPLLYFGAHTGRKSGYDKINLQNLTRVKRDKVTGAVLAGHLRFALKARPGYSIVAADLSNIEARIVAALARCIRLITGFRDKRDQYCEFASDVYGRKITKADEIERFVGKTCILGLGFGMGWVKLGMQMKIVRVKMGDDMLKRLVYLYRDKYQEIPQLWNDLEHLADFMLDPKALHVWGPLTFAHERIMFPDGTALIYPGLHRSRTDQSLVFMSRRGKGKAAVPTKLWGGVFTENIVQKLASIVIKQAEIQLSKHGLNTVLQVHDELVYMVPTKNVALITKAIDHVLCSPVSWLPSLPVACEIKHGPSYGDAK